MINKRAHNFIDLVGRKFERLLILELHIVKNKIPYWKCLCDCGQETIKAGPHIVSGGTKSCGCFRRLDKGVSGFNRIFADYKSGANKRNLDFLLSKDEFKKLTKENCHYCGVEPSQIMTTANTNCSKEAILNSSYTYNGIDRKDNSLGYTLTNSLPCCTICNRAKSDMDYR